MKPTGARLLTATFTMLALAALIAGCATVRPVVRPGPWDRHADSGPLKVYGADAASPGQQVFQALRREPALEPLFKREGQPDTLEVVGSRYEPKRILLDYKRKGAGRPRRIVLDATNDGFVARAPEPLATPTPAKRGRGAKQKRKKAQEPAAVREEKPPAPTAQQRLECPIDAGRADCQALCKGGATYEWCR
jgi:hypothetical protein